MILEGWVKNLQDAKWLKGWSQYFYSLFYKIDYHSQCEL